LAQKNFAIIKSGKKQGTRALPWVKKDILGFFYPGSFYFVKTSSSLETTISLSPKAIKVISITDDKKNCQNDKNRVLKRGVFCHYQNYAFLYQAISLLLYSFFL
jgi:hypothetical protein